jgi:hypothetical protein
MSWLFAILLAASQDPVDELRKEVEKIRKENQELRERLGLLEQAAVRDAELIQRLRTAVKLLEAREPAAAEPPPPADPRGAEAAKAPKPLVGPRDVLRAKVLVVEKDFKFVMIDKGKPHVLPGYKFDITRDVFENGAGEPKTVRIAGAEFEKYLGGDETHSKLRIIDGRVEDVKAQDDAVAIRVLPPAAPKPKEPEKREPSPTGTYRVTGRTGRGANPGYIIDYGSAQGAKQTDLLYVYRDGTFVCKLRLDQVAKDFSVAHVVDNSLVGAPPDASDTIYTKEIKKGLVGEVRFSNEQKGLVAINVTKQDGAKVGQRFEVRRQGQKVGTIVITEVQVWGCWAKPEGDTKFEDIQKKDFVEAVEEK